MYAVVDLETTGGNAEWHRITEVAVFVHDGQRLVKEFSSLINPGTRIPPFISQLTGITNEMVADAPPFEAVAATIQQITEGCVFVAHNVGFDYKFLRAEFLRLNARFERPRLCTVRTARKLLPGHTSYSLGNICRDLGISNAARHRAAGDARATVALLELMLERHGLEGINPYIAYHNPLQAYEGLLHSLRLEDLSTKAGLLQLLSAEGEIIGLEAVSNLQKKALQLVKRKASRQARGQLNLLHDMQAEETGSILLANLRLESEQVALGKKPAPKQVKRWKVEGVLNKWGYKELVVEPAEPGEIGWFKTKKAAQEAVSKLITQLGLCRQFTSLRPKSCLQNCGGACRRTIPTELYNGLVRQALDKLVPPAFKPRLLLDRGRHPEEFTVLVEEAPDRWRWGFAQTGGQYLSPQELAEAAYQTLEWPGLSERLKILLTKFPVRKEIFYDPQEITLSGV